MFKNFRLQTILRLLMIILSVFIFFSSIFFFSYKVTPILVGIILVLQVFDMMRYIQKTNNYITSFLESIRYSDFSKSYSIDGLGSAYDEMKTAFNDVIKDFQKIREDREIQHHYLETVIQHIGISLLAFDQSGDVALINNSAKRLFQMGSVRNIAILKNFSTDFVEKIRQLKSGEHALVQVIDNDMILQLAVFATEFRTRNNKITLVSIQNIQSELEEQEMAAWQKLIRVLTHEIMNSITPISSLSATMNSMLSDAEDKISDSELLEDLHNSLYTITKRSNGLISFVDSYRNLTRIPKPEFAILKVADVIKNIKKLLETEIKDKSINCEIEIVPENLEFTADEELIEQVLINLIKNAVHALQDCENPELKIRAFLDRRGKVVIQVIDNGPGIITEVIDKIFVPFFTTKPNGSGIGLSLSKQIMRMHGGSLAVQSEVDKKTVFTLRL